MIVAEEGEAFLGVLRTLADFSYRTFIANLAVVSEKQGEGIGRVMLQFARSFAPEARLVLFAAKDVAPFYQKLGFKPNEQCYQLKAEESFL